MCAIAGILSNNTSLVSVERLKNMTDVMIHRGPDGEGHWISTNKCVGLGHRRLSIIDLSEQASQPMHFSNRYSLVYNGEIYNYIELRETLYKLGYRFRTQSDTEVLLAAYDYWKEDCLQFFDGMFSFAIWDEQEQNLFAARDRFGEKPFYYYEEGDQFLFSSEMKGLWAVGVEKEADEKMILNYLTLGYVQNANDKAQTFFQKIYSLPPAHFIKFSLKEFCSHKHCYWTLDKENRIDIGVDDAIEKFNDLFQNAIRLRLRSDVPIGTSLSGGLDSSSISAVLAEMNVKTKSFSSVFPGFANDESSYIKAVTNQFQLENYTVQPSADGLVKEFRNLCYYQEEPFSSTSIYAQFKVYELAKNNGVKVLLDGQGADETLAGYHKYIHWYLQQLFNRFKFKKTRDEQKTFRNRKIPFKSGAGNFLASFFPAHTAILLEKNEYNRTSHHPDINPDLIESLRGREWEGIHKPVITKLNDILYFNTIHLGLEELLRFADRNSMAHGREVRLPFLSHELVEFIFRLPASYKMHDGWTKWLLRHSMKQRLPDTITWRTDKTGFEPPQKLWMENSILQDYIWEAKRKLVIRGILKKGVLDKKIIPLKAHDANNYDWRYLSMAAAIET